VVEQALKEGYTWVVDADLQSYFETIPKAPLEALVKEKGSDGSVLELLRRFLDQEVMEGMKRWTPIAGTPQGSVISPLMSNLYLQGLDERLSVADCRYVRYADDFVALCRTQHEAEAVLTEIQAWVQQQGLRLHPDKTRVGHCLAPGQGFEFLGYRFEGTRRYVRPKSLAALITDLNATLTGWFEYFKHADPRTFRSLDGLVRRRLRAVLRTRRKRPGQGHSRADHQRWPTAFFAAHGLFTLHEAWCAARQSR
jgi:RNA-directed DNA polymerase